MESLLTSLTEALYGSYPLALAASLAWGIASILLSPCHLSSIPLIIGFLTSKSEKKTSRGILLAFVFAVGILMTIAVIGIITAALGRIMGDVGVYGKYAVAVVFFVVGLYLMDLIRLPESGVHLRPLQMRSEYLSALVLGLVFGIALGPCTFAFMAPVLGVVFQMSDTAPLLAGLLLLAFGLGHCSVIVAAGGLTSRVQAYLDWTNRSTATMWIKRVAGFLVVLGGIYTLFSY
ncbi:MAG: cytochrome C biogenesis protein [Ignavibacteriales bacterium]|nr:cytochrome C biogenesis protein [Ignavibacteriales bacterium]